MFDRKSCDESEPFTNRLMGSEIVAPQTLAGDCGKHGASGLTERLVVTATQTVQLVISGGPAGPIDRSIDGSSRVNPFTFC